MPTILVDYENVNGSNGLKGADVLCPDDILIIFYSGCCGKIRYDYMEEIRNSGCEFRIIKLKGAGKNALDFYIAAECGVISERGERQIAIISNDKGFQAVIDFFCMDKNAAKVQVVQAGNIENALTLFHSPEDAARRKTLQCRKSMLDLAAECARLEERNKVKKELKAVLLGTAYEGRTVEIIDFISAKRNQGKKALYTGSLHTFGKKDGRAIYQLIKNEQINFFESDSDSGHWKEQQEIQQYCEAIRKNVSSEKGKSEQLKNQL